MKILLTTLNSKYIHSSLALRYIEKYCNTYMKEDRYQLIAKEFSINEPLDQVMAEIYKTKADIVAFACYIWNRDLTFELMDRLKKVRPELIIIAGGPEVSFEAKNIMEDNTFIDIIVKGEGELSFKELIDIIAGEINIYTAEGKFITEDRVFDVYKSIVSDERVLKPVKGIVYRNKEGKVIENEDRQLIKDLDTIPLPYTRGDLEKLTHKIIYYEASRGCPYNCSYCLSSTIKGVRSFSLERVKEDLLFFINNNVKQVKFVDRTFNFDKNRTLEVFKFLVENRKDTSFHFEMTADILDEEILDFIRKVPVGLFQFEIGVQTTNEKTLDLIGRQVNFNQLAENVRILRDIGNINLHLDLIAGLPEEDYLSFKKSFDEVYDLNPHVLQLGFLKLLKGSAIRDQADKYSYKYTSLPPYEVLENQFISYNELLKLKDIEDLLDKYHNSGVFKTVLKYIFAGYYSSYFSFYEDFAAYFISNKLHRMAHSQNSLYKILYNFYKDCISKNEHDLDVFKEYLKYDMISYNSGVKIPTWAVELSISNFNDKRYKFLDNEDNIKNLLPHYKGQRVKDILRTVRFEPFRYDVSNSSLLAAKINIEKMKENFKPKTNIILFDYISKERPRTYNVTEFIEMY